MIELFLPVPRSAMRKGMTLVELAVVVGVVFVIFSVVVSVLSIARKRTGMVLDGANLSSLCKSMALYGDGNKGHLPGLTGTGDYMATPFQGKGYGALPNAGDAEEEKNGEGCTVAKGANLVLALLLDAQMVVPKQLISTDETGETSQLSAAGIQAAPRTDENRRAEQPTSAGSPPLIEVRSSHFSHAMLAYGRPGLKEEWRCNMNQQACLLSSRMIFGGKPAKPGKFSSLATEFGSGQWEGSVAWGDASVGREKFQSGGLAAAGLFRKFKYGETAFDSQAETTSVVGIFGRSNDMDNFDATPTTGLLGSAND